MSGASNGTSLVLLSLRYERPLARLFVTLIREDDACIVVLSRGQRSIVSQGKPIAIPTLDQCWNISHPARWQTTRRKFFSTSFWCCRLPSSKCLMSNSLTVAGSIV